jgi:hypothetical protein
MYKMREVVRITLVCLCAFLVVREGRCDNVDPGVDEGDLVRADDQPDSRKDAKAGFIPGKLHVHCDDCT